MVAARPRLAGASSGRGDEGAVERVDRAHGGRLDPKPRQLSAHSVPLVLAAVIGYSAQIRGVTLFVFAAVSRCAPSSSASSALIASNSTGFTKCMSIPAALVR